MPVSQLTVRGLKAELFTCFFFPQFRHIFCLISFYDCSIETQNTPHKRSNTMKTSIITTGIVAGLLFASSGAMAASHGNNLNIKGVNVTQIEQTIKNGVRSGKLTTKESRTANAGLNSLKATIKAATKDRKITKREESQVQAKSTKLKQTINQLLNNKSVAKSAGKPQKVARR
jgi:septal ring factor EnvC (AmiA/AmiB activator)